MNYPIITQQIIDHLKCLGYTTEVLDDEGADFVVCRHNFSANFVVRVLRDFVMLRARFNTKILEDNIELHRIFDEIHRISSVTRWYTLKREKENAITIMIEAYTHGYDKLLFGELLMKYEHELWANVGRFGKLGESAE